MKGTLITSANIPMEIGVKTKIIKLKAPQCDFCNTTAGVYGCVLVHVNTTFHRRRNITVVAGWVRKTISSPQSSMDVLCTMFCLWIHQKVHHWKINLGLCVLVQQGSSAKSTSFLPDLKCLDGSNFLVMIG